MIIYPDDKKDYLASKPRAYQIGWLACESNIAHHRLDASSLVNKQYTEGYGDCVANTECLTKGEQIA
jgi:hypothetical protein